MWGHVPARVMEEPKQGEQRAGGNRWHLEDSDNTLPANSPAGVISVCLESRVRTTPFLEVFPKSGIPLKHSLN